MLKELRVQHQEVGRLRFQGFPPAEIATQLSMNYQSVCSILRDPLCKGFMAGLNDQANDNTIDVRKRLVKMNEPALDAMEHILVTKAGIPPSVILAAAKDVLDRNGYKPEEKTVSTVYHFEAKDIIDMKERQQKLLEDRKIKQIN